MVEGLQLAARFALPAYRNGSCGTGEVPEEQIIECVTKGNCKGVRKEFSKFATMYPYLKTIGNILDNTSPFHPDVVRAYWLGGDALSKAKPKHFEYLLAELVSQGFPCEHLDQVRKTAPTTFVPLHLYQVLLSHFLSGGTLQNLAGVNDCMVRSGTVTEISRRMAKVDLLSLVSLENKLVLAAIPKEVNFEPKFFEPKLKTANTVAVHLGWVCKNLTHEPVDSFNLLNWTKEVLRTYNA